jgi:hypothetical protein
MKAAGQHLFAFQVAYRDFECGGVPAQAGPRKPFPEFGRFFAFGDALDAGGVRFLFDGGWSGRGRGG